ncbi:hypothetical protein [Virgibacillus sp. DJP39]
MKFKKVKNIRITSVKYVSSGEFSNEWFEMYTDLIKEELLHYASKQ